jgi:uncharacterized protein (DUF1697 family)
MQSAAHHRGDPFFRLICRSAYSSLGYETPLQWPRMTNTNIVLLRAVNAGGVNSLPMKDFVQILEDIGLGSVRTYIQTGNAVFHARELDMTGLPGRIKVKIGTRNGFAPEVVVVGLDEMESAIESNPYPEATSDPKSVQLTFLTSAPRTPDLSTLENIRKSSERFALKGRVFYLHAPEGVARSRLFARIERSLGIAGTARNWPTACKILEIARQVAAAEMARGAAEV